MKRFLYYFVWTIGIIIVFCLGIMVKFQLQEIQVRSFNALPLFLFMTLFPVIIGMLLRLPKLIVEIRGNKKWALDWPKLLAVGVPMLMIYIWNILMFLGVAPISAFIMMSDTMLITVAGIVLGYVVLDSLQRD